MKVVEQIIKDVEKNGDKAVRTYTEKFDGKIEALQVSKDEIKEAFSKVDKETIKQLEECAERIRFFAEKQLNSIKEFQLENKGVKLGQKIVAIEKIGCYVPGGKFPLMSSALMTVIPAKVAGVKEIVVCSPKIKKEVIVAAKIAGADKIFRIGGVQAIAAMAFGTKKIPKVDKIVGPGNKYVAEAKRQLYGKVGIDMIAGTSDIMIIADVTANIEYIKADTLAQKEQDEDAKAILVALDKPILVKVNLDCDKVIAKSF